MTRLVGAEAPTSRRAASRMAVAAFALLGGLVALYLFLYDLGLSPLVCPVSGCEVVQASPYSKFLGLPVAGYGLAAYAALLAAAVLGLFRERLLGLRVQPLLVGLSGLGVLAYAALTYLELFVIHAVCFWCVTSSLMMVGAFAAALFGRRG